MSQPTTSRRPTPLLDALLPLLSEARPVHMQARTWLRVHLVTLGSLVALGRHTLSQVLVALGVADTDWTAWYRLFNRGRLPLAPAQRRLLQHLLAALAPGAPLPLVVDATQLPRSSRRFPGVGATRAPRCPVWRPGVHLAQRVAIVSGLLPRTEAGDSRAVPIRSTVLRTPRTQPFGGVPEQTEGAAAGALLRLVRDDLAALGGPDQPVLVLGDGAYSTAPVLRALPEHTWLLARCARNRALFAVPGPEPPRRGRTRVYGERGPTPQQTLTQPGRWTTARFTVRGRTVTPRVRVTGPWLVQGAPTHPVFLLVVKGVDRGRGATRRQRAPHCFLVSAQATATGWQLPLSVAELLAWAWQRWEVEVMHRELKSSCGLGDQQAWSAIGAPATLEWAL